MFGATTEKSTTTKYMNPFPIFIEDDMPQKIKPSWPPTGREIQRLKTQRNWAWVIAGILAATLLAVLTSK
jgi:hypothetical protein